VCCFADAVLLEGTVNGIAGKEGFGTEGLICLLAERAIQAGAVDPLHHVLALCFYFSKSLGYIFKEGIL
jgi:hypothetical protein